MTATAILELLEIDPRRLVSHASNLRQKKVDISELVASIRHNGVLEPLIVSLDQFAADPTYVILAGHRRAAAAVEAGLATVPCVVRTDLGADASAVHTMIAENVIRQNLTAVEEARGYAQLAMLGVPIGEIAKATGRKTELIEQAIAVTEKKNTLATASEYDLTLEQAIAISEFESEKSTVKELTELAARDPMRFAHTVENKRQDLRRKQAWEEAAAKYRAAGVRLTKQHPSGATWIDQLDNGKGKPLTEAQHRKCPGHIVWLAEVYYGEAKPEARFYCDDADAQGHKRLEVPLPRHEETPDQTAERKRRAAELDAAATVRKQWFGEFLARKHKADEQLRMLRAAASALCEAYYEFDDVVRAREQLGLAPVPEDCEDEDLLSVDAVLAEARDMDRLVTTLFAFTAGPHLELHRDWRNRLAPVSLSFLKLFVELGYGPADVELRLLGLDEEPEGDEE